MKTTASSLILAGAGLALAMPRHSSLLLKRTTYDLCDTDCRLAGLAYPNKHTLQLALENNWSEQCPQIYFGDASNPTATSRVCLEISGSDVLFNFEPFAGYSYASASVAWKLAGNAINQAGWAAPPPTDTITCVANGDGYQCKLPFSAIAGLPASSSIADLLAGMCPNGDREGLGLYFEFSGIVTSADQTPASAIVANSSPCLSRDSTGACTARKTDIPYIAMVYRCSTCNIAACPETTSSAEPPASTSTSTSTSTTSQPPIVTTKCGLGTAFGWAGAGKAITLNTQSGSGCNRWGWYSTPTLAELQAGVTGTLLVGAGGNDVSKATNVGTYTAVADSTGKVTVTYNLAGSYTISDAHVDLDCLPIDKCAPGQYTFNAGVLNGLSTYSTGQIRYPTCTGTSKTYLTIHASVGVVVTGTTCPVPIA